MIKPNDCVQIVSSWNNTWLIALVLSDISNFDDDLIFYCNWGAPCYTSNNKLVNLGWSKVGDK